MKLQSSPKCPHCGKLLDAATSIEKEKILPKDGDISICFYCIELNQFVIKGGEISLIKLTKEEQIKIDTPIMRQIKEYQLRMRFHLNKK